MPSTKCHAAVADGNVFRNVIVDYDNVDRCEAYSIRTFEGEVHSTDDFNGAIVIVPAISNVDLSSLTLTPDNFYNSLETLSKTMPRLNFDQPAKLIFLPL